MIHSNPPWVETFKAFYFPYVLSALWHYFCSSPPWYLHSSKSVKNYTGVSRQQLIATVVLFFEPHVCCRKGGVSVFLVYGKHQWLKHTHDLPKLSCSFFWTFISTMELENSSRACDTALLWSACPPTEEEENGCLELSLWTHHTRGFLFLRSHVF